MWGCCCTAIISAPGCGERAVGCSTWWLANALAYAAWFLCGAAEGQRRQLSLLVVPASGVATAPCSGSARRPLDVAALVCVWARSRGGPTGPGHRRRGGDAAEDRLRRCCAPAPRRRRRSGSATLLQWVRGLLACPGAVRCHRPGRAGCEEFSRIPPSASCLLARTTVSPYAWQAMTGRRREHVACCRSRPVACVTSGGLIP